MAFHFIVPSLALYPKCNGESLKESRLRSSMAILVLTSSPDNSVGNRLTGIHHGVLEII